MQLTAYLYFLVTLIEIYGEFTHNELVTTIAKPLLMPVLVIFYLSGVARPFIFRDRLMVAAFAFSWVGDVALMLAAGRQSYFLIGLVSFLITHVLYITAFTMVVDRSRVPVLRQKVWIAIPLAAYLSALLAVVFPAVPAELKVPVAIYSGVLVTMALFALNRFKRVNDSSFALTFSGALLFMFSDSLIGVDLFVCHNQLFMGGIAIMITYMAGQYLIAKGMQRNDNVKLT